MSLVFSNTSSFGSQLPVSDAKPIEPYLEFSVHACHTFMVGRTPATITAEVSALRVLLPK
jgi:hypothetical protein